jgi:hypothetical protein
LVLRRIQKNCRRLADVRNNNVDQSIIIKISERGSATGTQRKFAQTGLFGNFFERTVAEISMEKKVL